MDPNALKYTKDHEWVAIENGVARIGITDHAQQELGDIVFVELPEVGKSVNAGDVLGTIESVKAVSELYAPVSGTIASVNEALQDAPESINRDPLGEGWMVSVSMTRAEEAEGLLSLEAYSATL